MLVRLQFNSFVSYGGFCMTLNEYLQHLGWNLSDFCRYADINPATARKAVTDGIVSARTARKIAEALSQAMGKVIFPGDIQGLVIQN